MLKKLCFILLFGSLCACAHKQTSEKESPYEWKTIKVTATAYNSLAYQTSSQPQIAAWGDSLKPGMKCIAVSRDLLAMGLQRNTEVKLAGFTGVFMVKDKMNSKWRNRIDIYMGVDVEKAKEWGVRKINISYKVLKDSIALP